VVNEVMVDGSSASFGADEDAAIHPQANVSVHEAVVPCSTSKSLPVF